MNQQSTQIWLETLRRERRAKVLWQAKYLSAEEHQSILAEETTEAAALKENVRNPNKPHGRLSERDAGQLRLSSLDDGLPPAEEVPRPISRYEQARKKVAEEVAATIPRSHRFTGDLSTESMLRDIGPGLWSGVNPGYTPSQNLCSTSHATHIYDWTRGYDARVDKEHHLRLDPMLAHADKCLQLGEKPFVSGSMKLAGGR
ncbi:MAG: hypothetical protein SGPRY_002763 [Prymnesium sp.]